MYLRRSTTVKYFLALFLGAAVYSEWLHYLIQPTLYWPKFECLTGDETCTKILFIADPQIQGENAVPSPLSYIINWDSDSYLRSTFKVVMSYFKPDILVFLGDLMDEGSRATLQQYHRYVKRLAQIFDVDHEVMRIWIPGDNDIGGEHEPVYPKQVQEFERTFYQPSAIFYQNITFYKVNVITKTIPQSEDENDSTLNIVVSHYPVLARPQFSLEVDKALHPNIYFCAHDHESKYMTQEGDRSHRYVRQFYQPPERVLDVNFSDEQRLEIYVPTCSYRMGTSFIGYGAAIIDNGNHFMRYTVFWSPTRFPYLIIYLVIIILLVLYFLIFCVARLCNRKRKDIMSADMSPLLHRM